MNFVSIRTTWANPRHESPVKTPFATELLLWIKLWEYLHSDTGLNRLCSMTMYCYWNIHRPTVIQILGYDRISIYLSYLSYLKKVLKFRWKSINFRNFIILPKGTITPSWVTSPPFSTLINRKCSPATQR